MTPTVLRPCAPNAPPLSKINSAAATRVTGDGGTFCRTGVKLPLTGWRTSLHLAQARRFRIVLLAEVADVLEQGV